GMAVRRIGAAELLLARGDHAAGLAAYRDCAERMRELRFPGVEATGLEPWVSFGEGAALAAHAYHATPAEEQHGRDLFAACGERTLRLLGLADPYLDFPVAGLALFGLGAWALLREAAPAVDAIAVLALAERFAYNRVVPTMAWERIVPRAEARAPGGIAAR